MRSSIPDDSKIILVAAVILVVIGAGIIVDWLKWPVWLVAVPAVIGAVIVWLKLRPDD